MHPYNEEKFNLKKLKNIKNPYAKSGFLNSNYFPNFFFSFLSFESCAKISLNKLTLDIFNYILIILIFSL